MRAKEFLASIVKHPEFSSIFKVKKPLTVYKSAAYRNPAENRYFKVTVKLVIPVGAYINVPSTQRWNYKDVVGKMRATSAKVVSIKRLRSSEKVTMASSHHSPQFRYWVRKICRPTGPFFWGLEECESGIHFFRTRKEAEAY